MQLDIRNISKTYANGVQALKNVTLTIPPGMYGRNIAGRISRGMIAIEGELLL